MCAVAFEQFLYMPLGMHGGKAKMLMIMPGIIATHFYSLTKLLLSFKRRLLVNFFIKSNNPKSDGSLLTVFLEACSEVPYFLCVLVHLKTWAHQSCYCRENVGCWKRVKVVHFCVATLHVETLTGAYFRDPKKV